IIVNMAIGKVGVQTSVFQGTSITIVLYVSINLLEFFLNDDTTKAMFFGKLASDVTKAVISGVVATIVGTAAASTITIAYLPLVLAVGAGIGTSIVLSKIDKDDVLTKKLIKALEEVDRNLENGYDLDRAVKRQLKMGGIPRF
ncbi:MAG: hypothetical protein L3J59_12210, partial [Methylococcaceae bacterium]|nr:hypothetical protein [Methylococcaceae bacterium]